MMRRNPRKISWTVLYRKKHKKGTQEEVAKKRTRRTVKFQRAIQGASLEAILAKRNMKPEVRAAQRDQAIKVAKDKAKAKKAEKKAVAKSKGTQHNIFSREEYDLDVELRKPPLQMMEIWSVRPCSVRDLSKDRRESGRFLSGRVRNAGGYER